MGLLLGGSAITIVEVLDLFIYILFLFFRFDVEKSDVRLQIDYM